MRESACAYGMGYEHVVYIHYTVLTIEPPEPVNSSG